MQETIDCVYWGLFLIDDDSRFEGALDNLIVHKHVTFGFRTPCPSKLVGTEWLVKFTGYYGNDGRNEAFEVELPEELLEFYKNDAHPHMTVSVAKDGKPVDSANLDFAEKRCSPFTKRMRIGYFPWTGSTEPLFCNKERSTKERQDAMNVCFVVTEISWMDNRESYSSDTYRERRTTHGVFESLDEAREHVEELADIYYENQFEWLFNKMDYVWYDKNYYGIRDGGVRFSIKKCPYIADISDH